MSVKWKLIGYDEHKRYVLRDIVYSAGETGQIVGIDSISFGQVEGK
jgi:hypothetical protein